MHIGLQHANADESYKFEDYIQSTCRNLLLNQLQGIFHDAERLDMMHELSHRILVVFPKSESDHFRHRVEYASSHIVNLLVVALRRKSAIEAQQFCSLLDPAEFSKGYSGNIFDVLVHVIFDEGGHSPILKISESGPTNCHWETPKENPANLFLHINSMGFSVKN